MTQVIVEHRTPAETINRFISLSAGVKKGPITKEAKRILERSKNISSSRVVWDATFQTQISHMPPGTRSQGFEQGPVLFRLFLPGFRRANSKFKFQPFFLHQRCDRVEDSLKVPPGVLDLHRVDPRLADLPLSLTDCRGQFLFQNFP